MNSIEDRLARDAARTRVDDPPAPSLDLLLDRAVTTVPRRRPQLWLAVAAVLIVVAGVAALVTVRLTHDSSAPAAGLHYPTPHTIVRNGVHFAVGESSPIGLMRDPSDPNVVDVYVLDRYERSQPECSRFSPSARAVGETTGAVRLVTIDYSTTPIDQQSSCTYATSGTQSVGHLIRVRLDRPLAARTVIDVRTEKPLAVLARAKAPTPHYVPSGYRPVDVQNFHPPQRFGAERSYRNGEATLYLAFMEAVDSAPQGNITAHVTVHGRPALATEQGSLRCLMWSDPRGLESQVCSSAKSGPLPLTVLHRVADSLPH